MHVNVLTVFFVHAVKRTPRVFPAPHSLCSNTGAYVNVFQDGDVIAPELTPLKRDWHTLERDDEDSEPDDNGEGARPGTRDETPRKAGRQVKVNLFQAQGGSRL